MRAIVDHRLKAAMTIALMSIALVACGVLGANAVDRAYADDQVQYPNSATLDSLRTDRSYVVDALTVGARAEKDYGGDAFSGNPHLNGGNVNHYMYEDLLNEYEEDLGLKATVEIYKVKSDWENYPIESLQNAAVNSTGFMPFLAQIRGTSSNAEQNSALRAAYEALGGTYPTQETLKLVKEKKASDSDWADYSTATLSSVVDGTAAYDSYKASLKDSDDSRDRQVYSWLEQKESSGFSGARSIIQKLLKLLNNVMGTVDGETAKGAKIYDVILNDIFTTEYTSSAGVPLHKDFEAKTELDECTKVLKNHKDAFGYMSDAVDLAENSAQKILIDDYLDVLTNMTERKNENLTAALEGMDLDDGWYKAGEGLLTQEFLAYYYGVGDATEDDSVAERLADVKAECEERYFLLDGASKYLSMAKKLTGWSTSTLSNYYLLDALARENEYAKGVLGRTANTTQGANDASWKAAVSKYQTMLDVVDGSNVENQALISVLQTASEELNETLEKKASKTFTKFAREGIVSMGKDAATRASIATTLSKVSFVYTIVDTLDDYVAGLQDVAEKIYEIKYLLDVQKYAYAAYQADVAAYDAENDPEKKDGIAANALSDLQFLKQIKLRQIDDAYDCLSTLKDETLSGVIAKWIADAWDDTSLDDNYQAQLDAVLHMMICPVGGTLYSIPSGMTLTVQKNNAFEGADTYIGTLSDSNGNRKGIICEMEYLLAGGINLPYGTTLVMNCDLSLPQITGTGGTLVVGEGCDPKIGYVNGSIGCEGNVHIRGSVNGTVVPKTVNTVIEIDGNMECDTLSTSDLGGANRPTVLVHGDFTVYNKLSLAGVEMTVEGASNVVPNYDQAASDRDLTLTGAVFEAKGSFVYYGSYGVLQDNNQNTASELRIWQDAQFPNGKLWSDDASMLVMCGDGTASLHGVKGEKDGNPFYSVRIMDNARVNTAIETGVNVVFDTTRIGSLDGVYIEEYDFPQGLSVRDDSLFYRVRESVDMNGLTFEKNLEFPEGATYDGKGTVYVNGNVDVEAAWCKGTFITQGDMRLAKETSTQLSSNTVIGGDFRVESTSDSFAALRGGVMGDMYIGEGCQARNVDITVEGTLRYYASADWAEHDYVDDTFINAKGNVDLHVTPREGEDFVHIDGIKLCGGTRENPQIVTGDPSNKFGWLCFENAVASFPDGLEFQRIDTVYDDNEDWDNDIETTLTIVGEVPYFRGGVQKSGTIVFTDDVESFSLLSSNFGDANMYSNALNSIHAEKDVRLDSVLTLTNEKGVNYRDPLGRFKVDGTLTVSSGVSLWIIRRADANSSDEVQRRTQIADFGGTLKTDEGAYAHIWADELHVHGLEQTGVNDEIELRCTTAYWSGGNIIANDNTSLSGDFILESEEDVPTLGVVENASDQAGVKFESLKVAGAGLRIEGDSEADELTSDQESFTISGCADQFWFDLRQNEQGYPNVIQYRDATGLESKGSWDNRVEVWDVVRVEQLGDEYVYDADLAIDCRDLDDDELAAGRADAVRVRYIVGNWIDTVYYQKGSRFLLGEYVEVSGEEFNETRTKTILTTMYTNYACTRAFDLLAERAESDLLLGYKPSGSAWSQFADLYDSKELASASFGLARNTYPATGEPVEVELDYAWSGDGEPLELGIDFEFYFIDSDGNEVDGAPTDPGEYQVGMRAPATSAYEGKTEAQWTIRIVGANDLSAASVYFDSNAYTFTGEPFAPVPNVYMGGVSLVKGEDFELSYFVYSYDEGSWVDMGDAFTQPGYCRVVVTGINDYTGSNECSFDLMDPNSLSEAHFDNDEPDRVRYSYSGKPINPKPKIYDMYGNLLIEGVHYRYQYLQGWEMDTYDIGADECVDPGEYSVCAVAIDGGGYTGRSSSIWYAIVESGGIEFGGNDQEVVNAVSALVSSLPEAENVTLSDKAVIEAARAKLNALTTEQKALIGIDALAAMERKIAAAEAALAAISGGGNGSSSPDDPVSPGGSGGSSGGASQGGSSNGSGSNASVAKKANPMTVKAKTIKAKKSKKTVVKPAKAFTVKGAQGKVTYKVVKYSKAKKKITVSRSGKVTVKKGVKKGTYKLTIAVTAAGNANYKPVTKTITLKVKVK